MALRGNYHLQINLDDLKNSFDYNINYSPNNNVFSKSKYPSNAINYNNYLNESKQNKRYSSEPKKNGFNFHSSNNNYNLSTNNDNLENDNYNLAIKQILQLKNELNKKKLLLESKNKLISEYQTISEISKDKFESIINKYKKLTELQNKNEELYSKISLKQIENKNLRNQLLIKDDQLKFNNLISQTNLKNKSLQDDIKAQENEISRLQTKLNPNSKNLQDEINEIKQKYLLLEKKCEEKNKLLNKLFTENNILTNELQKTRNKNFNVIKEQQRLENKVSALNELSKKYDTESFDNNYYKPLTSKFVHLNKYKQRKNNVLSNSIRDKSNKFQKSYTNNALNKNRITNSSMNNDNYKKRQNNLLDSNYLNQNRIVSKYRIRSGRNERLYPRHVLPIKKTNNKNNFV